jgi:rod shape-determining protein MreC
MLEFLRRNQTLVTSGFLLALSLILVSANARDPRLEGPLGTVLLEGMRPVQTGVTQITSSISGLWRQYVALVGLQRENESLRQRILEVEREAVSLAEVEQTNQRLEDLLGFRDAIDGSAVAAQVIGKDPKLLRSFTINRGQADGVRKGMAALSPYGVVGQILRATPHAAQVLLITDHNSGIDAVVQRSRARGIVEGARDEGCLLKYIRQGEDVQVGDRVVTSGLDGIFPKGIVIGRVTRLHARSRGQLLSADIEPAVPFDLLEEVLVVDATVGLREPLPPERDAREGAADAAAGGQS